MPTPPPDHAPHVVVFGTYRTDLHPRVAVLVEGLRANGAEVTEVDEPLPLDTAARVRMLEQPWRTPLLLVHVVRCWVRLWRRGGAVAARRRPDVVVVGYMGHFDVHLARLRFPGVPVVLDHMLFAADTARDRGAQGAAVQGLLRVLDRAALATAHTTLVDTDEHAAMAVDLGARRVVVVPVGATQPWFAVPPAEPVEGPLRVLFFGLFTPLQGTPTLARAFADLPRDVDVRLTLVGTGQDHGEVARLLAGDDRVRLVPWADAEELLRLTAASDVVLGVFGTSDKARRVVPTKVYQGMAAGRAVVTSDTPSQRAALAGNGVLVPPGDAPALTAALRGLAEDRQRVQDLGARARAHAEQRFTATESTAGVLPLETVAVEPPLTPMGGMRWRAVRPLLERIGAQDVLEVGCGQGAAGTRIADLPGTTYTGVEPDPLSWAVAAERLGGRGDVIHGDDGAAAGLGRTWSTVCAFEVLEHIEDDEAALRRWHSLCEDGGHLVMSVPAWPSRFGPSDELVGHFRRYTPPQLRELLVRTGWTPVETGLYAPLVGRALEVVRNRLARRRLAEGAAATSMSDRSGTSGRFLQPGRLVHTALWRLLVPFDVLRRATGGRFGNGIVVLATRT